MVASLRDVSLMIASFGANGSIEPLAISLLARVADGCVSVGEFPNAEAPACRSLPRPLTFGTTAQVRTQAHVP